MQTHVLNLDRINIISSVNKSYLKPLQVMLFSLFQNNKNHSFHIFFINVSLSRRDIESLTAYMKRFSRCEISIIHCPESFFSELRIWGHFSKEIYARLLSPDLLPEAVDRALWIDADMIIRSDIAGFYFADLNGHYAAVCPDKQQNGSEAEESRTRLGLPPNQTLLNSGIVLFNLFKLRKDFPRMYLFQYAKDHQNSLLYPDQDVLNVVIGHNVIWFDEQKWSFMTGPYLIIRPNKRKQILQCTVLHYAGPCKPWQSTFFGYALRHWAKYAIGSRVYPRSFFIKTHYKRAFARIKAFSIRIAKALEDKKSRRG